jgi:bla regulator protein blaR1
MKGRAIALIALAVVTAASAQTPSTKKPAFDVYSVKLNTSPEGTAGIGDQPGGRFVAYRVPLRRVIQFAYRGNQDFIGGADWIDTDRWDIEGKAAEGAVPLRANPLDVTRPDTLALMVQSLLEDRFKLTSHQETRELPLYNLTVLKSGAKVKLSEDQAPPAALAATGARERGTPGRGGIRLGRSELEAKAQSMDLLATALGALYAGRPVVDKTGLQGLYDFQLRWTNAASNPGASPTTPATPQSPSLFDALEEELGLKLESGRGPLPVLVIDRIERPSEN